MVLEHGFNYGRIIKVNLPQYLVNLIEALTLHLGLIVKPLEQLQRIECIVTLVEAFLFEIIDLLPQFFLIKLR